ncbi:tetratricopeptide repeat protein [Streptomyces odontomachi]|uniref:tetratricopeptide repeat protein n=1 Tax=Streptomyces odontomachi TaxID=2944940 RepID=UPI00210B1C55|nr:tetratricopeptide repeat protein [Streptomyces sp. ODS25]
MSHEAADSTWTTNTLSGSVHGHSVQAGMIHGDVFIGADAGRFRPVPRQIPPPPRHFTDRTDSLAALDVLLESPASMALITGPAGVGKTSLALRWMHEHRADWTDGQLYVDLRGHMSEDPIVPSTVLPQFLRALGVPVEQIPTDLAEQTALYRTVVADRRIAVLCDNALSAAQVRPLVPASENGVCLVTSRWQLTPLLLDGAHLVSLDPFDTDSAVELLGQIVGQDRVAADRRSARSMVTAGGCFPLAVAVGAALLLSRPEWSLASAAARLTGLRPTDHDEEISMNASLDQSYGALPPDAARLYRRLGLHPGTVFGKQVAQAVAATAPVIAHVEDSLTALVDANLLAAPEPERFRFHDVIHRHARGCAETYEGEDQRRESTERIVDAYLFLADAADKVLYPQRRRQPATYLHPIDLHIDHPDSPTALAWFERERESLVAVQRLAAQLDLHGATWQLADAMWTLFIHLRYHQDWISTHELGVRGAECCRNLPAEARMRTGLGIALRDAGRTEEALAEFERALALRHATDDRRGAGLVLHNVGLTHVRRGDWARARSTFGTALSIREQAGDSYGVGRAHLALGEVESLAGRHTEALSHLTQAQRILRDTQGPYEALTERLLGEARMRSGDLAAARAHLNKALGILEQVGDTYDVAAVHEVLGELSEAEQDGPSARTHYARAEAVYTRLSAEPEARRAGERIRRLDSATGG